MVAALKLILCRNCRAGAVKTCGNCKRGGPPENCTCQPAQCTCRFE